MRVGNLEILASELSKLGLLCLRRRELLSRPGTVVTEVTLNQEFLMSSYITASERALATYALEMKSGVGLRVLVGGLGLGYTAHEVLVAGGKRVEHVEVVEYLPQVIDWTERGLVPLASKLIEDERLAIVEGDVFHRLVQEPTQKYDLILIDVDHSPEERLGSTSAVFYTELGLLQAQQHLTEGGVLGVWSYAQYSPFASALWQVFGDVRVEPITVWNDLVDEEQTDWLFFARNKGSL